MMFLPVATAAQGRGRSVALGFPGGWPMRHFEVGTPMADLIPIKGARSRRGIKLHRLNALPERPQREEVIESLLAVGEIAALVSPVRLWRPEFRTHGRDRNSYHGFKQEEADMALRIITADERFATSKTKTSMAIFGPSGVGKTSLLKTLPPKETLCIDLEAGMKSVQDWPGDSISVRTFSDALDIGCLVGGVNPAADPAGFFSQGHYQHLNEAYPDLVQMVAGKRIIFLDSITDLTRQAMAWAKMQPEAFSDKTGKPDTRAAYGLLARQVIGLLKHLQHAPAMTVIFVGILERITDEFNRVTWQPQMEGGKAARELPGIVDQVISMSYFAADGDRWRHEPERSDARRLVCRAGNPFGLPAKDRSGRLDVTEPPDLDALLTKLNTTPKG